MTIVFMDIDGTIADGSRRFLKAGEEPKTRGRKWSKWLRTVQNKKTLSEDPPVAGMKELCEGLIHSSAFFYLTGRSEIYREVTNKWLEDNKFPSAALLMRPKGNRQKNGELKEAIISSPLITVLPSTNVIVIDDDQNGDIEAACHRNGWTFLKAKSGGSR